MSNAPEWVDPAQEPEPLPPPSEREVLINRIVEANGVLRTTMQMVREAQLRLDEIGVPITRSRTRADKIEACREDWWAHFDYDVLKGMTKGTKDQQARAERYELS